MRTRVVFEAFQFDILMLPKEYIFYMDVPGLSKSDIQFVEFDEEEVQKFETATRVSTCRQELGGGKEPLEASV
ncbi:hypothetical protein CMV_009499 [Castanea mollissima]|uniref:Uncharacterized protein n=1 Tax=Castanea mollissima TaxID=60419 RepID=A0A8J4VYK8_9ROSI|nr:hypothetical protein CMV_009499 [Castanea mollissima]